MPKVPESQLDHINEILAEIEQSTGAQPETSSLLADIDELCNEVDRGVEQRKKEVENWPLEKKRKEAVDSIDPFVLNLLTMDESLIARTLAACNSNTPVSSLRRLAENSNDYTRMIVAHNPNVSAELLDRITDLTNEPEVIDAVKLHPNVSTITKYKIENIS